METPIGAHIKSKAKDNSHMGLGGDRGFMAGRRYMRRYGCPGDPWRRSHGVGVGGPAAACSAAGGGAGAECREVRPRSDGGGGQEKGRPVRPGGTPGGGCGGGGGLGGLGGGFLGSLTFAGGSREGGGAAAVTGGRGSREEAFTAGGGGQGELLVHGRRPDVRVACSASRVWLVRRA